MGRSWSNAARLAAMGCAALVLSGCIVRVLYDDEPDARVADASIAMDAGVPSVDADAASSDAGAASSDAGAASSDAGTVDASRDANVFDLTGCVLHLGMEEASWAVGTPAVADGCGGDQRATPMGGAITVAGGRVGRAASFDGTGCLVVPNAESLHPTTALTLAFWFHATTASGDRGLVSKRTGLGSEPEYSLYMFETNRLWYDLGSEDAPRTGTSRVLDTNRWYHVALTYDGTAPAESRVRIYVDGVLEGAPMPEASANIAAQPSALHIGCLPVADWRSSSWE